MVNLLLIISSLLACPSLHAALSTGQASNITDGNTPMMRLLANVDGKSFFQEWGTNRDWAGGETYCASFGMTLASITSQAQFNALKNAYDNEFAYYYWTSGRDSLKISQYEWNYSGSQASSEYLAFNNEFNIPHQTCLMFHSMPDGSSTLLLDFCTAPVGGVLCET